MRNPESDEAVLSGCHSSALEAASSLELAYEFGTGDERSYGWTSSAGELAMSSRLQSGPYGMDTKSGTTVQAILCTNDRRRLQSFYSELFGAEEVSRVPEKGRVFSVSLRLGDSELGIVVYRKGAAIAPARIILAVFVENVDELLPRVEPAGGRVLGPANDMPWGHRVAHVTDPDGNPVNLTQRL